MKSQSDFQSKKRLSPVRIGLVAIALALILLSWWGILNSQRGLISQAPVSEAGVPLLYFAPANGTDLPGVIIAHGFAGSKQLMLGYGRVLAQAGYAIMLLDFDGHGSSRGRLDRQGDGLQRNLEIAYQALLAQPEIDPSRIALLGHSMGSGAVMRAGIEDWQRYSATIAVSPTGADVSPERPRNFLLQAGALEPQFAANADNLLAAAGGDNDDLAGGRGRKLVIIPNVEHITILFSQISHQAALDWLNDTFDLPATTATPDRRMLWYVVHLAGWLLLLIAVSPLIPGSEANPASMRRVPWHWVGALVGAFVAVGAVSLLGRLADVSRLGGLLVGGVLGVWFLAFGLVWLLTGFRLSAPAGRDLLWGLILFGVLTLAFGVMAQLVWLPWWLVPDRLVRWPLMAAAVLPWLLAAGLLQHRAGAGRLGWWLIQTLVIVLGLGLTVLLNPGLFFVVLLIPVIPLILAIMAIAGGAIGRPWSYAIGNALFFGWLLVAVFPLA